MTKFITYFFLLVLFAVGLSSYQAAFFQPPPATINLSDSWHEFAQAANEWVIIMNNRPEGTVSVDEYRAYEKMKLKWHKIEPQFNQYYHQ